MNKHSTVILTILILIGGFLRLYNLNWGSPFYFHPDERNIATAVSLLQFPTQMNPQFFAYGSLPIYVFFLTGLLTNFFLKSQVLFEQAILISRIYSALFSILLIPLMYAVGKLLYSKTAGLFAAILTAFSVGLIQFAHFGTYETLLTFFSVLLFFFLLRLLSHYSLKTVLALAFTAGILVAVKISSLALIPIPILAFFWVHLSQQKKLSHAMFPTFKDTVLFLSFTLIIFLLTNPFMLLAYPAFQNSMQYETSVAAGTLPVFYTQEFIGTLPILFHFRFVYPFLLNPVITLLFFPAFLLFLYYIVIKKRTLDLFLLLFFLALFVSQVVLFVKWTRYLVPTLPFIYLILTGTGYSLGKELKGKLRSFPPSQVLLSLTALLTGVFALSYVYTVFVKQDPRVQAAAFAKEALPKDAQILSEVYDLGIIPFNSQYSAITLFNFYDMDLGSQEASPEQLGTLLNQADFIILPSQRLYKTRLMHPERYLKSAPFYLKLRHELGYKKIYETPCDLFCRLIYLGNPMFSYEETATVFDRPTVQIYQKL